MLWKGWEENATRCDGTRSNQNKGKGKLAAATLNKQINFNDEKSKALNTIFK